MKMNAFSSSDAYIAYIETVSQWYVAYDLSERRIKTELQLFCEEILLARARTTVLSEIIPMATADMMPDERNERLRKFAVELAAENSDLNTIATNNAYSVENADLAAIVATGKIYFDKFVISHDAIDFVDGMNVLRPIFLSIANAETLLQNHFSEHIDEYLLFTDDGYDRMDALRRKYVGEAKCKIAEIFGCVLHN